MNRAYLDAFSGLSGDMVIGALIDAGADFNVLQQVIAALGLGGFTMTTRRKTVSGISAIKFDIAVTETQPERHLREICEIVDRAGLSPRVRRDAIAIFEALAQAEAKVHHTTPDKVHFHEVGAVDSIIDVVAAAWGLDRLGIDVLTVSPLPMGTGFAKSRHGVIPVPAPATAELLKGFVVRLNDGPAEMVTPTGAAIIRALGRPASTASSTFEIERVGYGAGTKDFSDRPNVLRILIGREREESAADELFEIATNIDDLNPQIYDYVNERLFAAGARDVTITPVIMKKGRPGVILTVLCQAEARDEITAVLFAETSTIGIRFHRVERVKLARTQISVDTPFGKIRVKISGDCSNPSSIAPEYDDCHAAARTHAVPLKAVIEEARAAAHRSLKL
jgi:pyridinium-3,5-bisthiocarboxylic acid mononucleotide nickel chelatase